MGGERQHVSVHGVGNLNGSRSHQQENLQHKSRPIVQLFQESFRATLSSSLHTEVNCVNNTLGLLAQPHSQTSNCSVLDHLQSAVRYSVSHRLRTGYPWQCLEQQDFSKLNINCFSCCIKMTHYFCLLRLCFVETSYIYSL